MVDLKHQIPEDFYNEEIRFGYKVTKERKEIWAVLLDLLSEFDRVCRKNGLKYYADGGTALGAVRHNGFIPWDDDIDLTMFRSDYEMLCRIAGEEFSEPFFFQTEHSDPGSMRDHAQLRNSRTSGILLSELDLGLTFNQGIFIDIFPIDNIPDNDGKVRKFLRKIRIHRMLAKIYARCSTRYRKHRLSLTECIIRFLHLFIGKSKTNPFFEKHERYLQRYDAIQTARVSLLCFLIESDKFIWQKSWYDSVEYMQFEFLEIPVCKAYDEYLTRHYGNWRVPVQGPSLHGGVLFDVNKAYTEYINK